jgi:fructose-1,6-bisphosphatase II
MNQITVVVLDRPRHQELIERIKKKGANVRLISDGDVFGAVMTAFEHTKADMLIGIGAAPEGVLAATALKCVGGYLEGRLKFRNEEEKQRARKMGINDFDKIYTMDELVKTEDAIFVATGVTDGDLLKGVHKENGKYKTQSMIISSENKKPQIIDE